MDQRTLRKVLSPEEIISAMNSIVPGDTVEIQFKEADLQDLNYLWGMDNNGFLTICSEDNDVMHKVLSDGKWGDPVNRIFQLIANDNWDLQWFKGRLAKRLESVIIVKN